MKTFKKISKILLSIFMIFTLINPIHVHAAADTSSYAPKMYENFYEGEDYIFANGTPITIEAAGSGTAIWYMDGSTKKYVNPNGANGDDLSGWNILAGSNNADGMNCDGSITMTGGTVNQIYAGQFYGYFRGTSYITITGGNVNKIFCQAKTGSSQNDDITTVTIFDSTGTMIDTGYTGKADNVVQKKGNNWNVSGNGIISEGITVSVSEGETLTVPSGATLTNNGTLVNNGGTIKVYGKLLGNAPKNYIAPSNFSFDIANLKANVSTTLQEAVCTTSNIILLPWFTYEIVDKGNTEATLSGRTITPYNSGTVKIKVTMQDGYCEPVSKTFDFPVSFTKVMEISGDVPAEAWVNTNVTLPTMIVSPEEASYKSVVWSVANANGTGATINGSTLKATYAGTATIRATIENGTAYGTAFTKDYTVIFKELETIDISLGSITVSKKDENTLTVSYSKFSGGSKEYSISQSINISGTTTSNSITVESNVNAEIVFSNITIEKTSGIPVVIKSGSNINLMLHGKNIIKNKTGTTGDGALVVQKNATLRIDGEGSLTAESNGRGAAIGGTEASNAGTIIILGGTIVAKSTANSTTAGAAIGGGGAGVVGSTAGNSGTIIICGGTITASATYGAGIGNGAAGTDWNGINPATGGTVIIYGGTVNASSEKGSPIGKASNGSFGTLTNGYENGNQTLSKVTITLNGVGDGVSVFDIDIPDYYSTNGVVTMDGGKIYLWLPADTMPTCITLADGTKYICNRSNTFYTEHLEFEDANCLFPSTCTGCGTTIGETTEHSFVDGICSICGQDENGHFHISTAKQLMDFAEYVNKGNVNANATLTADIDLTGYEWEPIGLTSIGESVTDGYTGTFDGNGHVIKNVTFKTPTSKMVAGIFGTVQSGGTVKNLGVDNLTFDNNAHDQRVGGIAGQVLTGGLVEDCYVVNSTVNSSNSVVGGIIGLNTGTAKDCYTYNVALAGYNNRFGGIVGDYAGGTVENCYTDYSTIGSTANGSFGTTNQCESSVSEERFASGEITYKLNGSTSDGDLVWYQTLTQDAYPMFKGSVVRYNEGTDTYSNHTHIWEYEVDGTTIIATCTASDCTANNGGSIKFVAENNTYTANPVSAFVEGTFTNGATYKITYNGLEDAPSAVGTYTAKLTVYENEVEKASVTANYSIEQADGAVTNISDISKTYDGNPVSTPTFDQLGTGAATVEYKVKDADDSTYTTTAPKDACDYVVRVTVAQDTNYKAASATAEFTITPANIDNAVMTLDKDTFVYDKETHKPKVTVTFNGNVLQEGVDYKVTYLVPTSVENGEPAKWFGDGSTSVECINAGDYYAVVQGIGNYYVTDLYTLYSHFVIEKATVTKPIIVSKPYNGDVQVADISNSELYRVLENNGGISTGSYDVVLILNDTENYKWESSDNDAITLVFEITSVENAWVIKPSISGWIYGESANVVEYKAKFGNDTVKMTYTGTSNDGTEYNSETAPKDAGDYTVTLTVKGNNDYSGLTESVNFTIEKATYDMLNATWNYVSPFAYDGKAHTVEVIGLPQGVTVNKYTNNTASEVGEYVATVEFTYDEANYNAVTLADLNWKVVNDWTPVEYFVTVLNINGWLNDDFVVTAEDGYELSLTNMLSGEWYDQLTVSTEGKDQSITFYLRNKETGAISKEAVETFNIDKTALMGTVTVAENNWTQFLNDITFNMFFNKAVDVVVNADDALSGVDRIEYIESDEALTLEEVKQQVNWTVMNNGKVSVTPEDAKQFVYYIRITDKAGNVTYLSTNGAVFDISNPVINGINDGSTYFTSQAFTVIDTNLERVTVNGNGVSEYVLAGNVDATYTIVAIDKAGNSTIMQVTMKTINSLVKDIETLTNDNVTEDNKATLDEVLSALNGIDTENASDAEKAEIQAYIDRITELEKVIEDTDKVVEDAIKANDERTSDNVTSDDKEAIEESIKDIEKLLNDSNVSDAQKDTLEEAKKEAQDLLDKIAEDQIALNDALEEVKDITNANVTEDNAQELADAKAELEKLKADDNYTETEKVTIQEEIDRIEALEKVNEDTAKAVEEAIKANDERTSDNVTSDDKETIEESIKDIEELLNDFNVSDAQKETLEQAKKEAQDLLDKIAEDQNALNDVLEEVKDVTDENYTVEDKEALKETVESLEDILADDNYTETVKEEIQTEINRIKKIIDSIEKVEDVIAKIEDVKETLDGIENETDIPDNKEFIQDVLDAINGYENLTDKEKTLISEELKAQLDEAYAKVVKFVIILGSDGIYTKGIKKDLTFTANGHYYLFVEVRVDGNALDVNNYEAVGGSTVITLKFAYLETLQEGKHTLDVVYEVDGNEYTATCEFTIEKTSTNPNTGDSSNVNGWMTMMLASILGLFFFVKRRKEQEN